MRMFIPPSWLGRIFPSRPPNLRQTQVRGATETVMVACRKATKGSREVQSVSWFVVVDVSPRHDVLLPPLISPASRVSG